MTYTLTFSKKIDGVRQTFMIDGKEATLQVDADSKTSAIYHDTTVAFCTEHGTSVRRIL